MMTRSEVTNWSQRLGGGFLDLLFPPRCLACGGPVHGQGNLCAACWKEIGFLSAPCCDVCGYPFDFPAGEGSLCGACLRALPPYRRGRALMLYGGAARRIILALKHGDRLQAVPSLAAWMVGAFGGMLAGADALVPVPLHHRRLFMRHFNQSALLARALAARMDRDFLYDGLIRCRATPSQKGLTRRQRHQNVRGAFKAKPQRRDRIEGRRLVLIDDVMTTGATLEACTRALLRAGAADVDVLTIARVVQPEPDII